MDTGNTEKAKGPKVYSNEMGESCLGFMVRVLFPLGIIKKMQEKGEYDNDLMARRFVSDFLEAHFAPAISEFEQSLDADSLISEFLAKPDGRKERAKVVQELSAKNREQEAEIARLRAVLATHIAPSELTRVPQV